MPPETSHPDLDRLADLGEYQLLDKLGEGGMGAVYRALHTRLDKIVALKMLPASRDQDDALAARFDREMKAVGQLNHPNIVQAYDARKIGAVSFLVMEYIEGVDLSKLSARCGPLAVVDACEAIRQAALGLQAAHEHGLVHRDVKLSNLMLTDAGLVKVLDLGLARFRSDRAPGDELTASGQIMGTVDYMAPEQVSDCHHVDIRADIYSLGCALYRLLCGRTPFEDRESSTPISKMVARLVKAAVPIRQVRGDVPPPLAAVVDRTLAQDPKARFATPAAVAAALAPFAAGADLVALCAEGRSEPGTSRRRSAKNDSPSRSAEPSAVSDAAARTGTDGKLAALCREMNRSLLPRLARRQGARSRRRLATILGAVGLAVAVPAVVWRYGPQHAAAAKQEPPTQSTIVPTPSTILPTPSTMTVGTRPELPPGPVVAATAASTPADAPTPAIAPLDADRARRCQEAWAKYLGVAVAPVNSIGMKLVLIPPGEFDMGSAAPSPRSQEKPRAGNAAKAASESPRHHVRISRPFYMGVDEVTQAEYEQIMGHNPSHFQPTRPSPAASGQDSNQLPVENLSWEEAQEFCSRLSALWAENSAGRLYRLPTEAEWEFACRAGTATQYSFGNDPAALNDYAWFNLHDAGTTHAIGRKQANAWQLHDMLGNVYEWCADLFRSDYYNNSPATDPRGPAEGLQRVIRGGSWFGGASFCRSAARVGAQPDGSEQIGFRVLCEIPGPPTPAGSSAAKPRN